MGLLKRLVEAIEKISERKPLDAEQMLEVLQTALQNQTLLDERMRIVRMKESYDYLKTKEKNRTELTAEEKGSLAYGEEMVRIGKLKPYTVGQEKV